MYKRLENCPVCNGSEFKNTIICKDYLVSQESFVIVECQKCKFSFTNPRPIESELSRFYNSDEYISHNSSGRNLINSVYKIARHFTLRGKLNLVKKVKNSSSKQILDVGCGTGDFLNLCNRKGWKSYGVEPNDKARTKASIFNKNKVVANISEIDTNNFDIITLWHVLEHIPDLNKTIDNLKEILSSKGKLIVAVPNNSSWDAEHYKQHWAAYDVPRHLYHFTQQSFSLLMKKHKLKIEAIIPMKLDSYYVSLLSEKYQQQDKISKGNIYINSILNGYKSNSYAKKHANNFSSLIYIIKK